MLRRTKDEVDLQLPPKVYSTIDFKIDNKKEYKKAEDDFIKYLKEDFDAKIQEELEEQLETFIDKYDMDSSVVTKRVLSKKQLKKAKKKKLDAVSRAPALAKIQTLKLLAAEGKMQQTIDWIADFLESGEKLIVFAVNKVVIDRLMREFPYAVKIDGSVSTTKRNKVVKQFQNDPKCRLFIGNIQAAGTGLTLTAASKVAIVQFPWNPGELLQAEDRAHRITQQLKVTIYKFVAKNTIEERIIQLLRNKQIEIDKIIDGKNAKAKKDMVRLLINQYQNAA